MEEWIDAMSTSISQASQSRSEWKWVQAKRPYYDLYPAIIPLLEKVDLSDVPSDQVAPQLPQLVIRFPKVDHPLFFEYQGKVYHMRSIFFAQAINQRPPVVQFSIDYGETDPQGRTVTLCRHWSKREGSSLQSVQEAIEPKSNGGVDVPPDFLMRVAKVLASICMLANDPELIQSDVLASDRTRFAETGDNKYVERAHRRGKRAWTIGKTIEKIPHYRRSHLAKFWIGPGRVTPILRLRKGGIVCREKVLEVPTGYLDGQFSEVKAVGLNLNSRA
ncbi:hypothetical protein HOV93_39240 [Planctomycetes bacterium FF15]|uniref:Uncharacterized protein n=1 Tax=Bremerella alba TaxID=980252 RepID=A0A7V9A8S6_9BACT|nr:hypothetical protein [Bremerella alba]